VTPESTVRSALDGLQVLNALDVLGWTPELEKSFETHAARRHHPARVTVEHRGGYVVRWAEAEGTAAVSGRFRFEASGPADFPAVGDWVAIAGSLASDGATIHAVLPRRTSFTRLAAGLRTDGQVIAANVDVVFVAMALDGDFNLRRLERYLAVAWSSGADPVVLLTKADKCDDVDGRILAVETIAPGVPTHALSARAGFGLDAVREHLGRGRTGAVLGSSGVGKSTLINALLGVDLLDTGEIREDDDRGRHTTTQRQLIVLPGGACIVDTPGMRELGLWEGGEAIENAFADIDELAAHCRFSDCRHEREPGCAVSAAIDDGSLPAERLQSRRKLEREAAKTEARRESGSRAAARRLGRTYRDAGIDAMARKSMFDGRGR
jgi:ribosome biogenesis GTPase / thiamine phosphate phosphatase